MANVSYLQNNLGAGETSPRIRGRVDTAAYHNGAEIFENEIPLSGGAAIRRPGTYFVGNTIANARARLMTFVAVNSAYTYILEATAGHLRMWNATTRGLVAVGTVVTDVACSYTGGDILGLDAKPVGASLWVVHQNVPNRAGSGYLPLSVALQSGTRCSGSATSTVANKLVDSAANFTTSGVLAGDVAKNTTGNTYALVTAVDSATQLSLGANIMVSGESYTVYRRPFTTSTPAFTGDRNFSADVDHAPSIIFLHQGRLGLGGTFVEPDMVALSRSPLATTGTYRFQNFTLGVDPDHAIIVYCTDDLGSGLRWAAAHKRVAVGAEFSSWQAPSGLATVDSFYLDQINGGGCAKVRAVSLENMIFYVSAPKPCLHMLLYSEEGGGMVDLDITKTADHILEPGVVEIAVTTSPVPIVWCVRTDGVLVSATIDTSGGSLQVGWARHIMAEDGLVESICSTRESAGEELWLEINRGGVRTVEYLTIRTEEDDDTTELHYVDCGKRVVNSPASATVSGLDHLNGYRVDAIADGGSMPRATVAGGAVTYDREVEIVHVGLPFTTTILPNKPELSVNGTWIAKKKRVEQAVLRILRTIGGKVGTDLDNLHPIPSFIPGVTLLGSPPTPITGDAVIPLAGAAETSGQVYIVQDQPWPLTVLALVTRIAVLEV